MEENMLSVERARQALLYHQANLDGLLACNTIWLFYSFKFYNDFLLISIDVNHNEKNYV